MFELLVFKNDGWEFLCEGTLVQVHEEAQKMFPDAIQIGKYFLSYKCYLAEGNGYFAKLNPLN